MGTKNNPGRFDCYAAADPDEPIFVLLARDDIAPFLVSIWSSIRYGDEKAARRKFNKLIHDVLPKYIESPDITKASEALDCALSMFEHQRSKK